MTRLLVFSILILTSCTQPIMSAPEDQKEFFYQLAELKFNSSPGFHINGRPLLFDSIQVRQEMIWKAAKNEPLLDQRDKRYIKDQLAADTIGTWEQGLFDSVRIVSYSYIDSIAKSEPDAIIPPYIRLSKPYFSKDKQYCIVYYDYYCGSLCAETTVKLYKKVKGKWTVVKSYFKLVS